MAHEYAVADAPVLNDGGDVDSLSTDGVIAVFGQGTVPMSAQLDDHRPMVRADGAGGVGELVPDARQGRHEDDCGIALADLGDVQPAVSGRDRVMLKLDADVLHRSPPDRARQH